MELKKNDEYYNRRWNEILEEYNLIEKVEEVNDIGDFRNSNGLEQDEDIINIEIEKSNNFDNIISKCDLNNNKVKKVTKGKKTNEIVKNVMDIVVDNISREVIKQSQPIISRIWGFVIRLLFGEK